MNGEAGSAGRRGAAAGEPAWVAWLVGLLLGGGAIVFNQSAVHWRANVADSQLFAYYGWMVGQGARPYLDVWDNKPPGAWFINALASRLAGTGVAADVLAGSAALAISLASFWGVARQIWNPSVATWIGLPTACVLLTHLGYEGGANRIEPWVTACELAGVCLFLQGISRGSTARLAAAGAALGLAPWFKQSGLGALLGCGAALAWALLRRRRSGGAAAPGGARGAAGRGAACSGAWRQSAALGGGLAAVQLAGIVVLALYGALPAARFAILDFNSLYFQAEDATFTRLGGALELYAPLLRPMALLALLAAAAGLRRAWDAFRGRGDAGDGGDCSAPRRPPYGWLLATSYLLCVGVGRQGYHLLPVLAPLGLAAMDGVARLFPRGMAAGLAARPTAAIAYVFYLALLGGSASSSVNEARGAWTNKTCWWSLDRKQPEGFERQGVEIDRLARPDERIYVWGWSPGTYRHARRWSACRFATLEKVGQLGERARFILDEVRQALRARPPAVFVASIGDLAALSAPPRDDFGEWLVGRYRAWKEVDGMVLMVRNDLEGRGEARPD